MNLVQESNVDTVSVVCCCLFVSLGWGCRKYMVGVAIC